MSNTEIHTHCTSSSDSDYFPFHQRNQIPNCSPEKEGKKKFTILTMKTLKSQLTTCHPHLSSTSLPFLSKPTLNFRKRSLNFKVCNLHPISSSSQTSPPSAQPSSSLVSGVGLEPTPFPGHFWNSDFLEEAIEKVCLFFSLFVDFINIVFFLLAIQYMLRNNGISSWQNYAAIGVISVWLMLDIFCA